jgi:hypothetical protein
MTERFQKCALVAVAAFLVLGVSDVRGAASLSFYSLTPCRIVDTRGPTGITGGPALTQGNARSFPVMTYCGVPTTAKAAMLNITMVTPTADVFIEVWQNGLPNPHVSNVNALANEPAIANGATVPLAGSGLDVTAVYGGVTQGATSHLIIDVMGYFQ